MREQGVRRLIVREKDSVLKHVASELVCECVYVIPGAWGKERAVAYPFLPRIEKKEECK